MYEQLTPPLMSVSSIPKQMKHTTPKPMHAKEKRGYIDPPVRPLISALKKESNANPSQQGNMGKRKLSQDLGVELLIDQPTPPADQSSSRSTKPRNHTPPRKITS
jgi:hypothetical protein